MISRLYTYCMCAGLFLTTACTSNFEEWNTNPHQATDDMLDRDNLNVGAFFVQMQKNVFVIAQEGVIGDDGYQTTQNLTGDIFSGYMGANGYWYSNSHNGTYNLISAWCDVAYNRAFVGVMTPWKEIKNKAEEKNPMAYALATVVKVAAMHRVTDMYGPLPYLNFGNGALQNTYDSQKDIYWRFFEELEEAINVLTDYVDKNPNGVYMSDYDNVYDGNVTKWVKFANTLRLRLAMRIRYVEAEKAKEEAEKAVNHKIGVMMDKTDTAALQHSKFVFNHPLYIISEQFNETRMGANMDSFLNGYNDPRIATYFRTSADGKYRGIRTGIYINSKELYGGEEFSRVNFQRETPVMWMNAAEAYFLRAEGALLGWNMKGDEKSLYEDGIRTSFDYCGVSSSVDTYLADDKSIPAAYEDVISSSNNIAKGDSKLSTITIAWNDEDSEDLKMERIITQKWIAMFPDGQEAWSEFRRTGYPRVFPVVVNNGDDVKSGDYVRRIPFSSEEYINNKEGVESAIKLLNGPDRGDTRLWWDVNKIDEVLN